MRIGIVGAENTHCAAVAKTLNIEKKCGSARVLAVWGETTALAHKAANEGNISKIARRPEDMLGLIDGVMIDHRHPKYHAKAARIFMEHGIPCFVDKPFTYTSAEGVRLLRDARKKGVPITSFSVIPEQEGFKKDFLKKIKKAGKILLISSSGPCDFKSRWGGIFFYGIHQVDAVLKAFGGGIKSVRVIKAPRGNASCVIVMKYANPGPLVSLSCVTGGATGFCFNAMGTKATVIYENRFDPNPYLSGIKKFIKMFRTGKEPFTYGEIMEPICVLEAIDRSWRTGKEARVKEPNI